MAIVYLKSPLGRDPIHPKLAENPPEPSELAPGLRTQSVSQYQLTCRDQHVTNIMRSQPIDFRNKI